jgi:hypothetical protein
MAQVKIYFRMPDGMEIVMPEDDKPLCLAMAGLESGHGTTGLAGAYNLHAMKKRDDILVNFPIGTIAYNGGDGLYDYCACRTLREEIITWWAFLHRYPYAGIDFFQPDKRKLLNEFGPIYCPPGYEGSPAHAKWVQTTGFQTYTDYLFALLPEAVRELRKYGWTGAEDVPPVVVPPVVVLPPVEPPILLPPASYSVINGMLDGPFVHRRLVSNHDRVPRLGTIGGVIHATGNNAGTSNVIVDGIKSPGIFDSVEWNDPKCPSYKKKSAHLVFLRNGLIWQAVDLTLPAYHCYDWNDRTLGFEFENFGPCNPASEILGWFYRFPGRPWEQRVAKSEMVLINGLYYPRYTDAQIDSFIAVYPALRAAFPDMEFLKGHNVMPKNAAWDPGPAGLFPWERVLAAVA